MMGVDPAQITLHAPAPHITVTLLAHPLPLHVTVQGPLLQSMIVLLQPPGLQVTSQGWSAGHWMVRSRQLGTA